MTDRTPDPPESEELYADVGGDEGDVEETEIDGDSGAPLAPTRNTRMGPNALDLKRAFD